MATNRIQGGFPVRPVVPTPVETPRGSTTGVSPAHGAAIDSFTTAAPRPLYTPIYTPTLSAARFGGIPLTRDQANLDQALASVSALDGDPRGRFVAGPFSTAVRPFVS